MTNSSRLRRSIVLFAIVLAGLAATAQDAFATHFRYGTITWSTPNPATPWIVHMRFESSWRWSFPWGTVTTNFCPSIPGWVNSSTSPPSNGSCSPVGSVVSLATMSMLNAAGTNISVPAVSGVGANISNWNASVTITSVNPAQDTMSGVYEADITLPTAVGPTANYIIQFSSSARISTLQGGNNDQAYTVRSTVTVRNPVNRPPTSASLPVIAVPFNNLAATFTVPAFDPDGDALTFSFPTQVESGLVLSHPANMTLNASTGLVTWNTVGTVLGGLYAVQFKVVDSVGASGVVDVIVTPVNAVGAPPTVLVNGVATDPVFSVVRGSPMSFVVTTNGNGSPVTLSSGTLPVGSGMSPSLPTQSATGNVSSTFLWTPLPGQVGTYLIPFAAVNGQGQQGTRNVQISVTNNPPTNICSASGGTIEATGPGGAIFSVSSQIADPDNDKLNYLVFIDGIQRFASSNITPPSTVPFSITMPLGNHTYETRVTDTFSPTVTCSGNFAIVDHTAPSITVPANITLTATSGSGAVATFSATATDSVDTTPTIVCTPPTGSTFPVGTTTVTCTATDDSTNSNSASFTVTVNQAATSLTTPSVPATSLVGGSITSSATLTRTSAPVGALGGQTVTFTVTRPDASSTTLTGVTSGAGLASVSFTPTMRGVHSVSVSYAGTASLQASTSAAASFTVYQRTSLSVSAVNAVAGDPAPVSATLTTLPQNTPVSGQTVSFSFLTSPPLAATTDSTGVVSANAVFPAPAPDTATATFFNPADFFVDSTGAIPPVVTTAAAPVSVAPVIATLTHSAPITASVTNTLLVSANLNRVTAPGGPLGGQSLTFTLSGPAPATMTVVTDSAGAASASFPLSVRGAYSVSVSYVGTAAITAAVSTPTTVTVYQRTSLALNNTSGVAGAPTSFSAQLLNVPQGTGLSGQQVQFAAGPFSATGVTDGSGLAVASITFPDSGTFTTTATFYNADFYTDQGGSHPAVATVSAASVTITKASSAVGALGLASNQFVGDSMTVPAVLTRVSAPAGPVSGENLSFSVTGASSNSGTGVTDALGQTASAFSLAVRGQHHVSVSFAGSQALEASSASQDVTVYQKTLLSLSSASGIASSTITLTASLTSLPGSVPLAGQSVVFSFGGVVPDQTALTDGSGVATVDVVFTSVGTFNATASFTNLADFFASHTGALTSETSSASIAVTDSTAPVVTPTISGTLGTNGWYTSDVAVSWTVTDPETAVSSQVGCGPATISTDGAGITLTCTATSGGGTTTETVTIKRDTVAPALTAPLNQVVSATGTNTAVNYPPATATDATSGLASVSCAPPSGSLFGLGTTAVACEATDAAGNQSTASFNVTVNDNTPPVMAPLPNISQPGTNPAGLVVSWTASANDAVSGSVTVTCVPASGSTFGYGSTPVTCSAADGASNTSSSSFTVTVTDATAPVIVPTVSGTMGANGWYTSNVSVSWAVTDAQSAISSSTGCTASTVSTDGASFSFTCEATSAGGTSTLTVTFKRDATAPALTVSPNLTVPPTSSTGATVTYAPATATDGLSGVASVSCAPPSGFFPVGTTTVNCTATDNAGNSGARSFTVTVSDPTPPVIVATVTGTLGANNWYTSNVTVSWSVTDPESGITSSTGCTASTTTTDGASFTKTCTATSVGGTATKSVTFKRDASVPTITVSPNKTDDADSWDGTDVTYAAATATDPTSGIASVACTPASGSTFPIGVTTVSCVATNNAGLTKTGTFTVTIVDRGEPGKMFGNGETNGPNNHEIDFDFAVLENGRGNEWGDVNIKVRDTRRRRGEDERFDARTVDDVFFSNAPDYGPGHNSRTGIDTVIFRGTGKWDGRSGYTYVVTSSDRGEPGRGRDTFTIEIKSPTGAVVFTGGGTLTDGNVQSSRGWRPWGWWNGHHNNPWHR